ncbi:MAG: BACON domain-containing protein, partial [Alistipes sp.]|nr:BACON domain-containing protein [Alistipes sp.]
MKSNYLKFGIGILMILLCACEGGSSEPADGPEGPDPGAKPFLSILPTTRTVGSAGGEFSVSVSSNTAWTVEPLAEWISVPVREGEKSSSVKIRCGASTVTSRSGEVMFSAEGAEPVKLRVTQGDKTFTNPLGGVPDPWIIQHAGWY